MKHLRTFSFFVLCLWANLSLVLKLGMHQPPQHLWTSLGMHLPPQANLSLVTSLGMHQPPQSLSSLCLEPETLDWSCTWPLAWRRRPLPVVAPWAWNWRNWPLAFIYTIAAVDLLWPKGEEDRTLQWLPEHKLDEVVKAGPWPLLSLIKLCRWLLLFPSVST